MLTAAEQFRSYGVEVTDGKEGRDRCSHGCLITGEGARRAVYT